MSKHLDFVFDGPPDRDSPRLVEVEDEHGRSVRIGEWIKRAGGFWVLRLTAADLGKLR